MESRLHHCQQLDEMRRVPDQRELLEGEINLPCTGGQFLTDFSSSEFSFSPTGLPAKELAESQRTMQD